MDQFKQDGMDQFKQDGSIKEHIISGRKHLFTYQVAGKVQVIMPEYIKEHDEDFGLNGTRLILAYDDNHMLLKKTFKSSFDKLMRETGHDYQMLSQIYQGVVDKNTGVPIPLNKDNILIQLRLRNPQNPKDGAMGRVNCINIAKTESLKENKTLITFNDGLRLVCFQKLRNVRAEIYNGYLVKEEYLKRFHTEDTDYNPPYPVGEQGR